ncbi:MAG: hypothetical protein ACXVNF_00425 [Neobacillus sp.]
MVGKNLNLCILTFFRVKGSLVPQFNPYLKELGVKEFHHFGGSTIKLRDKSRKKSKTDKGPKSQEDFFEKLDFSSEGIIRELKRRRNISDSDSQL